MLVELCISPILVNGKELVGNSIDEHLGSLVSLAQLLISALALRDVNDRADIFNEVAGIAQYRMPEGMEILDCAVRNNGAMLNGIITFLVHCSLKRLLDKCPVLGVNQLESQLLRKLRR